LEDKTVVKGNAQILVASFLMICSFLAKADSPVFGNDPNGGGGFSITYQNPEPIIGAAIEFTPSENIDLNSVTLWLSGYTGQYDQTIQANIWLGYNNTPYIPYIDFNSPTPNDGTLAAFDFCDPSPNSYSDPSGSMVLLANVTYWLVVQPQGTFNHQLGTVGWVGGGNPTGNATYDQADVYDVSGGEFTSSTVMPAFTINTVPEPGFGALMSLPLLFGFVRILWKSKLVSC
jgi:hypothetical protein